MRGGSGNWRRKWLIALAVLFGSAIALQRPIDRHLAAIRLLRAMQSEDRSTPPPPGKAVSDLTLADGTPISAFVYGPPADRARLSVVLGHGIHHAGIHEPRLIRFARHLADRDVRVLTPLLSELADYRITESGVDVLRASVRYMARDGEAVGLIGFSFAGGLALLAAEDEDLAPKLRYVASIGGYHDLSRTLRFLATDRVEGPLGTDVRKAHEYGLLVLLYGHLDRLSFGQDTETLTRVLRSWLEEDRPAAREAAQALTTDKARHLVTLLEAGRLTELSDQVLPILDERREELARLSPSGRLSQLKMPLVFLHGAGDTVVPPEETLWADRELESGSGPEYTALSTPLLEHVRVDHEAGLVERLRLVHLVAQLL